MSVDHIDCGIPQVGVQTHSTSLTATACGFLSTFKVYTYVFALVILLLMVKDEYT